MGPPPTVCVNDPDFRVDGKNKKSCTWISLKGPRKAKFCSWPLPLENCLVTCDVCCADDPNYEFLNELNAMKPCKWLAKKKIRQEKYCGNKKIKVNCAKTCGYC